VILDDGGNLKAFIRMDGAPIPTIEMAQNKAYTALFGVPTQDAFNLIKGDPSLLAGIPRALAHCGLGWRVSDQGEWRTCRGDRGEGPPTVQNDIDCASAALALVCAAVGGGTTLNLQGNPTEKPMC
jgi:uncharacterized protein GlcG (DUF336 family)